MTRSPAARRPPGAAVVAAVLVLVALLAPPSSAAPTAPAGPRRSTFPPDRPTRVLAVGDSVMEGAAAALPAALPGREVTVDTEVSRSTGASAASAIARGTDVDVLVVLLGHNDGGSPGVYQPAYRGLLDAFAAAPRIVVLTLHEVRPYYAAVNAFLRDQAASRANVRVADWHAIASANPGATAGDGLHLTGSGAGLLADLVAGEVATAELDAAPPPTTLPPPPPPPPTTLPPTTVAPTTAPPTTTTTLAPTTTTTTEAPTTTTTEAPRPQAAPDRIAVEATAASGGAVSNLVWPALLAATGALAGLLRHVGRRFPH
ncbi:MAG TPA: hypothetical protein VHK88_18220 [Aquihabitans sp.]|jgi:lysophospholipase L1-like esterase|nr:hypothetical protein [Aquihabitans sp.]